jgi:hypothetical protein
MRRRAPIPAIDAAEAWQDVLSRGFQVFAYYHWWSLEQRNRSFAKDTTCITIKNAALESSLMSIRDLDDFFLCRTDTRQDDLIASDYGFPAGRNFLSGAERDEINKKLAHLTYRSAQELHQDPLRRNPRTWNNAEMVNKATSLLLEFLNHLESVFFVGDSAQIGMIYAARKTIQLTLKNINAVAQSEMDFTA